MVHSAGFMAGYLASIVLLIAAWVVAYGEPTNNDAGANKRRFFLAASAVSILLSVGTVLLAAVRSSADFEKYMTA